MSLFPATKTVLSLCDLSGNWSRPYEEAGYNVIRVDLQNGGDVRLLPYAGEVYGVLAAPPLYGLRLKRRALAQNGGRDA